MSLIETGNALSNSAAPRNWIGGHFCVVVVVVVGYAKFIYIFQIMSAVCFACVCVCECVFDVQGLTDKTG